MAVNGAMLMENFTAGHVGFYVRAKQRQGARRLRKKREASRVCWSVCARGTTVYSLWVESISKKKEGNLSFQRFAHLQGT